MFKFADIAPQYMTVELIDGTELNVCPPTKATYDRLTEYDELRKDSKFATTEGADQMYELFALYLSRNKENEKFSANALRGSYTIGHVIAFIEKYYSYIFKITSDPN